MWRHRILHAALQRMEEVTSKAIRAIYGAAPISAFNVFFVEPLSSHEMDEISKIEFLAKTIVVRCEVGTLDETGESRYQECFHSQSAFHIFIGE